jgi:hypothetical protein
MKYEDSDLNDQSHEPGILYWKLLMRLEHLLNLFFIERLLLKLGHAPSELLSVSFDMITYTLPFWTHQDTLRPLRGDCEWLVSGAHSPLSSYHAVALSPASLTTNTFSRLWPLALPRAASYVKSS